MCQRMLRYFISSLILLNVVVPCGVSAGPSLSKPTADTVPRKPQNASSGNCLEFINDPTYSNGTVNATGAANCYGFYGYVTVTIRIYRGTIGSGYAVATKRTTVLVNYSNTNIPMAITYKCSSTYFTNWFYATIYNPFDSEAPSHQYQFHCT